MAARPPTLVLTAALVLDDVLVVERAQDVNLPPPASVELRAAVRLESLHGHHLARAFVSRVIAVQADLAEMTLAKMQDGQRPIASPPPPALPTCRSLSNSQTPPRALPHPDPGSFSSSACGKQWGLMLARLDSHTRFQ